MHKGDTYGVPSKYWNGVLSSGRTVNHERTKQIQRNDLQMERQVKLLKVVRQCSSQFVSGSIVRVPVCVRALLRQTRCSDDLFFGANRNTVLAFRSRGNFSTHVQ